MSALFLIRHGQAGLRDHYDTLSETGRHQAQLLGRHLASQPQRFDQLICGALQRQRQTAAAITQAYRDAGIDLPDPIVDPRWNEFDLAGVYAGIAPQLAADDPDFRSAYETLQREAADRSSAVHRRWTSSDIAVVRAWVDGRYQYNGESWIDFTSRIRSAIDSLRHAPSGHSIAVSTSATPIGISMGVALELAPRYVMRSAGALYNASITSFRLQDGDLHLFTFNHIPHLADPALRTFR